MLQKLANSVIASFAKMFVNFIQCIINLFSDVLCLNFLVFAFVIIERCMIYNRQMENSTIKHNEFVQIRPWNDCINNCSFCSVGGRYKKHR